MQLMPWPLLCVMRIAGCHYLNLLQNEREKAVGEVSFLKLQNEWPPRLICPQNFIYCQLSYNEYMGILTKRWNDPITNADGWRILVCHYRPRALKKEFETWDVWFSELG